MRNARETDARFLKAVFGKSKKTDSKLARLKSDYFLLPVTIFLRFRIVIIYAVFYSTVFYSTEKNHAIQLRLLYQLRAR